MATITPLAVRTMSALLTTTKQTAAKAGFLWEAAMGLSLAGTVSVALAWLFTSGIRTSD